MGTQRPRPKFWLGLAVTLACIIVGSVIGVFVGAALSIWFIEGGDVLEQLLRPGPWRDKPVRILLLAIGVGIGGRVGFWASVGLMRRLGLAEEEIWGPPIREWQGTITIPWTKPKYWLAVTVNLACAVVFGLGGLFAGIALYTWLVEGESPPPWSGPREVTWPAILIGGIGGGVLGSVLALWIWGELASKLGFSGEAGGSPGSEEQERR